MDDQSRIEAAEKIRRKYGVLIDASSLSDQALQRVLRLKNFPRVRTDANLNVWNSNVFGSGERVNIFLPRCPHQNTRLGTVQSLSHPLREGFELRDAQLRAEYEEEQELEWEEGEAEGECNLEWEDDEDQEIEDEVSEEDTGALREDLLGRRVLESVQDELDDLEPAIKLAVGRVLTRYADASTCDVFDMVQDLLRELNPSFAQARRLLNPVS